MTYDPQRSHRRPRLAEEAPPPVDALLEGAGSDPAAPADVAEPIRGQPVPSDAGPRPLPEPGGADDGHGARRAAIVGALVVVALMILLWRRRRHR